VSRNEAGPESDLDLIVEFDSPIGIRFVDLAYELEEILKLRVDLVSWNGVKAKYFHQIKEDLVYV
jgi:predicted nucleotidyltransferase